MKEGLSSQSQERIELLDQLAERIANVERPHPVRAGIDGIETSGKSTLANELAPRIAMRGRPVIRASVDDFHAPRAARYRQGRESPNGYYEDSFDYPKFKAFLLDPLGPNGDRKIRKAALDWSTDAEVDTPEEVVAENSVVLIDGIFLLRPELLNSWDYRVFIYINFDEAIKRALQRDKVSFGSEDNIRRLYSQRYHPAQREYLQRVQPHTKAEAIVDNNDPSSPKLIFTSETTKEKKEKDTNKLKVQFVSRDLPVEGSGGTSAYRLSFLKYLHSIGCDIEYLLLDYKRANQATIEEDLDRFNEIMKVKKISLSNQGDPPIWSSLPTDDEKAYVQEQTQLGRPDLVIADHPWLAGVFEGLPNATVKAVLTHDVQHQKIKDFKKAGVNPYKRNSGFEQPYWDEQLEQQFLEKADLIIAIQKEDSATFQRMLPDSQVVTMPMAASLSDSEGQQQVPGRCLFVGGGAGHNVRGITWFLDNIWPRILTEHQEANLHVCGDVCNHIDQEKYATEQSRTIFKGRVDDLSPEYQEAEVCLVPLEVGSGLKLKLIEAMAYGRSVVSTSVGVQGVEEVEDYGVMVANTAESFAEAVTVVLQDPEMRRALERLNKQYIEANFLPEIVYGNFISRVEEIAGRLNSNQ